MQKKINLDYLESCRGKILGVMINENKEMGFKDIKNKVAPYSKSVILGELSNLKELNIVEYSDDKPRKYKINDSAKEDVKIKKILKRIKLSVEPDATIFDVGKSHVTYPNNPENDFSFNVSLVSNKIDNADPDLFKLPLDEAFEGETLSESIIQLRSLHSKLYDKFNSLDCHQELKDLQNEIYIQEQKVFTKSEFMGFQHVLTRYMLNRLIAIMVEEQQIKKLPEQNQEALVSHMNETMKEPFKIIITVNSD